MNSAVKSVFNHVAQGVEDAFAGVWFESMHPAAKVGNNIAAIVGAGAILCASSGLGVAFGAAMLAATASEFRMAGRNLRLGRSPAL
jgi:hypothetical protein